jgi:lysophospholipase L1-like esterase
MYFFSLRARTLFFFLATMISTVSRAAAPDVAPERLDPNFSVSQPGSTLKWFNALQLTRSSAGWPVNELASPWDRLPAKAEKLVSAELWALSRLSAGIEVHFSTDATEIGARWTLINKALAMDHMPATGMSGLDLYVRVDGKWQWLGVGRPTKSPTNLVRLASVPPGGGMREYRLYLPLYNGIADLQIGIPPGASLSATPPAGKSIVVYGTSITQGGCASRPGMAYTAILGRMFDMPVVNLGFSGNGKAEGAVATLVSELNPSVFVLDPLPNMTAEQIRERIEPFIAILRAKHPRTPIVMMGHVSFQYAPLAARSGTEESVKNLALKPILERLMAADDRIYYLPGDALLGNDGEATVDGKHPTDLGFSRMATAMAPVLKAALANAP